MIEYGEEGKHNVQDQTHSPHNWHQIMIMVCSDPERQMCNKEHAWYKHKSMQNVLSIQKVAITDWGG